MNRATSRRLKSLGFERKPGWFPGDRMVYWQRTIDNSTLIIAAEVDEDISYDELANRIARQGAYRGVRRIKNAMAMLDGHL